MSIHVQPDSDLSDDQSAVPASKLRKVFIVISLVLIAGSILFIKSKSKLEQPYQLGAKFDKDKFLNTPAYVPVLRGSSNVPSAASIKSKTPKPGDQGVQGSCVGWAVGYAAHSASMGQNAITFSPSYLFNQIALENCDGSYLVDALDTLEENGGLPIQEFPYTDQGCGMPPSIQEKQRGKSFAIHDYQRLANSAGVVSIAMIKEHIDAGNPVPFGMMVPSSFIYQMNGKDLWQPIGKDEFSYGGHAMTIISYDDNRYGGALEVINSWTTDWGNGGYAWITYESFSQYVFEAYAIMAKEEKVPIEKVKLAANISLVKKEKSIANNYLLVDEKHQIGLSSLNGYYLSERLSKGDCFKVLVDNRVPLYMYVFAKDQENGAKIIFPYSERHSDYISTAGKRVFPDDFSFCLRDEVEYNEMVVILSKDAFDYESLKIAVNATSDNFFYAFKTVLDGISTLPIIKHISKSLLEVNQELEGEQNSIYIPIKVRRK